MAKILIVDDDAQLRKSFQRLLTSMGHELHTASSGEQGLELVKAGSPDLVIQDVRLPGMNGLETFKRMREIEPKLPVIIMTAYGTTDTAIEATKLGAFDYVLKPFEIQNILEIIEKALTAGRFMRSRVDLDACPESAPDDALLGRSPLMQEVYKAIGRAAPTEATVLIRGESGTGKELAARALYQHSLRSDRPFLIINCVAIPETLLESELFGYEKGAFTGAVSRRVGKIEQANHGTVFLDEIGDMPLSIQAKVLRLIQERNIERLGGRAPIPVDVRIIAATNRDLESAVAEGRFREDLYYRLKVVTLNLPPLRDRAEDIPLLSDYFLARYAREMECPNPGLTKPAKEFLLARDWPGNVRELSNTMQKALIFSPGVPIEPSDLLKAMDLEPTENDPGSPDSPEFAPVLRWIRKELAGGGNGALFDSLIDHFGRLIIREALEMTNANRTKAAKLLGMSRPTLLSRIEKYGLKFQTSVSTRKN